MSTFDRVARLPPALIVAGCVAVAVLLGVLLPTSPRLAVLAIGGAVYLAFVLIDLPIAVGLWIVALYLAGVPGTTGGPTGTTVVLVAGCLGTIADRRAFALRSLYIARWAYVAAGLIILWSGLSILWAADPDVVRTQLPIYVVAALALPVIVTSCVDLRALYIVCASFVAGGTCAVFAGIVSGTSDAPVDRMASFELAAGRLHSGNNDPNYLAADLVATLLVVMGLLGVRELRRWRLPLLATIPVLVGGLIATQSRGGIISLVLTSLMALVLLREHRRRIGIGIAIVLVLVGAFLVAQPRAVDRITQDDSTGTGRTTIWHLATHVARDHPVLGVGMGNFQVVEGSYVDRVGLVEDPAMFVDTPLVVHEIWLQAATETGIPGLLLQLSFVVACIGSSFAAARRFGRRGQIDVATFARAIGVGQLGMIVASTFLSNGNDRIFWVLMVLGPSLLAVATTQEDRGADADATGPAADARPATGAWRVPGGPSRASGSGRPRATPPA
jgi:O-antigen ligase